MNLETHRSALLPSALQQASPWGVGAACSPSPPGRAGAVQGPCRPHPHPRGCTASLALAGDTVPLQPAPAGGGDEGREAAVAPGCSKAPFLSPSR